MVQQKITWHNSSGYWYTLFNGNVYAISERGMGMNHKQPDYEEMFMVRASAFIDPEKEVPHLANRLSEAMALPYDEIKTALYNETTNY